MDPDFEASSPSSTQQEIMDMLSQDPLEGFEGEESVGEESSTPEQKVEQTSETKSEPEPGEGDSGGDLPSPKTVEPPKTKEVQPKEELPKPGEEEVPDELALLKVQLEQMRAQLEESRKPQQETQQPVKETKNPQEDPEKPLDYIPTYQYEIPESFQAGLKSEDPKESSAALHQLMTGMSRTVHASVLAQVKKFATRDIPAYVNNTMSGQSQAQQVFHDFYGKFPALNKPDLYPVVASISQAVQKELGVKTWTPELRDAIGRRAYEVLKIKSQTQAQPTTKAADPPPNIMKPGVRPQAKGAGDDISDEILALRSY